MPSTSGEPRRAQPLTRLAFVPARMPSLWRARTEAWAFLLGSGIGLITLAAPAAHVADRRLLLTVCCLGIGLGAATAGRGARLTMLESNLLGLLADALVSVGIVAMGDAPGAGTIPGAALQTVFATAYGGVMLNSVIFFPPWQAALQSVAAGTAYLATLLALGWGSSAIWLVIPEIGVGLAIAWTVGLLLQIVRQLGSRDGLTGLTNREVLRLRAARSLAAAARQGRSTGLLLVDLDGFKQINDTYGHDAGDQVLVAVASRFRHTFRSVDAVCRWGGDEFVVLLDGLPDPEALAAAAASAQAALAEPIALPCGMQVVIRASVGTALGPGEGSDLDALLRVADAAMYAHKRTELRLETPAGHHAA